MANLSKNHQISRSETALFPSRLRSLGRRGLSLSLPGAAFLAFTLAAYAAPSQDDIFRSIQQNVETSNDSSRFLPYVLVIVAAVIVIAVVAQRRADRPASKTFNHPGKLMKEVTRHLPVRPAEMKQLKQLADATKTAETPAANPLALMLCPSQLSKLAKQGGAKQDRKALASLLRKLGAA